MGAAPQLNPSHFKKGQSGNPSGRPKLPPELRAIPPFTANELSRIIAKYGRLTVSALNEVMENPKANVMDVAICKIFATSIEMGDYGRLSFLLDRCIGKAPISEPLDFEEGDLSAIPTAELLQLIKKAIPDIKQQIEGADDRSEQPSNASIDNPRTDE